MSSAGRPGRSPEPGPQAGDDVHRHDAPSEPTGEVDFTLRTARYWITVQRPYYSRALFACRLLVTSAVETMTIDQQWRIYSNPAYIKSLAVAETAGLIIHNLNHGLRAHADRSKVLSIEAQMGNVWTVACDCEIDDDLVADGLTLPEDVPFPYMFDMENGQTAERYYRGLFDGGFVREVGIAPDSPFRLHSCGSAATDFAEHYELDGDELSAAERQLLRHGTAEAIRDHLAKSGWGSIPAGLERWAEVQLKPKVDWRKVLVSAVSRAIHQRAGSADYSWRRLPRRQNPGSPLHLPGMIQPVPSVSVVIDTSGSMSQNQLAQGVAEIEAILTRVVPGHAIRVLSVDADVAADARVFSKRQLALAGGGTDRRHHRRLHALARRTPTGRRRRHRRTRRRRSAHRVCAALDQDRRSRIDLTRCLAVSFRGPPRCSRRASVQASRLLRAIS